MGSGVAGDGLTIRVPGSIAGVQKTSIFLAGRLGGIGKAKPPTSCQSVGGAIADPFRGALIVAFVICIAAEEFPGQVACVKLFDVVVVCVLAPIGSFRHGHFLPTL